MQVLKQRVVEETCQLLLLVAHERGESVRRELAAAVTQVSADGAARRQGEPANGVAEAAAARAVPGAHEKPAQAPLGGAENGDAAAAAGRDDVGPVGRGAADAGECTTAAASVGGAAAARDGSAAGGDGAVPASDGVGNGTAAAGAVAASAEAGTAAAGAVAASAEAETGAAAAGHSTTAAPAGGQQTAGGASTPARHPLFCCFAWDTVARGTRRCGTWEDDAKTERSGTGRVRSPDRPQAGQ
jgi:hypothetical protein